MTRNTLFGLHSLLLITTGASAAETPFSPVEYRVQLDIVSEGYDGKFCWFHPRAGAIPGSPPTVVLTLQRWRIAASDVFYPVSSQWSLDLGKTWSAAVEHTATLGRRPLPGGREEAICDFTPKWHAKTGTLLGTGQTVQYDEHDTLVKVRPRSAVWSCYDPAAQTWSPWGALKIPDEPRFNSAGAGSSQRVDLENGDVLLPIYSKEMNDKAYFTTVVRCTFDGKTLTYAEHGSELSVAIDRGLYEPSLAKFRGKYYLTMRNDRAAYVAVSDDGLHFNEPRKWTFDDGADLGSYNTQAHWLTHTDGFS